MIRLSIQPVDLLLKEKFTTFIDSRTVQHSHIITLEYQGLRGYGEVTSHPFYKVTRDLILQDFDKVKKKLDGSEYETPSVFWEKVNQIIPDNNFLKSGLDIASHDLYGKINQKRVADLWGWSTEDLPISSYTIGIDTPEVMLKKMRETPWSSYKIKLGTKDDIGIIKLLRQETTVPFRVDANCAWDAKELESMNAQLVDMNIEFIEQPIHADRKDEIKLSKSKSFFPVIADESFKTIEDLDFCASYFDGINIKLVKCGGLTPAKKIIEEAQKRGLKIMVGCMTESSIGISAASQLISKVDYVDLDGALLIQNDTGVGTILTSESTMLSKTYGIGFRPFKI